MAMKVNTLLLLTPAAASIVTEHLSFFFLTELSTFDLVWDDDYLDYQMFSTISFASTCDWNSGSLLKTMAGDDPVDDDGHPYWGESESSNLLSYEESTCGETCKLLTDIFGGMPQTFSIYSPSDHTTVTTFWKHSSMCSFVAIGQDYDCKIVSPGGFFSNVPEGALPGVAWFLSFRGTFMWDVVNMRRNFMYNMVLISMCAQCAAGEGAYRNFIALRFALARSLANALGHIPPTQQPLLSVVGTSMGGQLAQLASLFLSVERSIISQNVHSLITHGAPRLGNAQLAAKVASGVDLPYINFIMYRDLTPHVPPMVFGFKSASKKMFWLYLEPWYEAKMEMGDHLDSYEGALRYKEFTGGDADKDFATSSFFYDLNDHLKYFVGIHHFTDLSACGGFEDKFFHNNRALRFYD
jgi:hypothetical protein